jgi:hypothetical protein
MFGQPFVTLDFGVSPVCPLGNGVPAERSLNAAETP